MTISNSSVRIWPRSDTMDFACFALEVKWGGFMSSGSKCMSSLYEVWLDQVRDALRSVNMQMEDWQPVFEFNFPAAHDAGDTPDEAAMKANKFWWYRQNQSLKTDCRRTPRCWLPKGHHGGCQPLYDRGDYVKVEFPDDTTGI